MNELRIVRGTDIRLYAADTPLFGVTGFTAREKVHRRKVYEYLSAKPCETIAQGSGYEIELDVMALFDRQLPREGDFVLCVRDGDTVYRYEHCRVIEQRTEGKGNGIASERILIEADSMERRSQDE